METETLKEIIRSVIREELTNILKDYIALVHDSEKRIDRTNEMIDNLSNIVNRSEKLIEKAIDIYENHISSIESAREQLTENNSELIKANIQLTHLTQEVERNAQATITGLRAELQSAKVMYNETRSLLETSNKTQINIERK